MSGKDEKSPERLKKSLSAPPDLSRKRKPIDLTEDSDDEGAEPCTEEQLIELVGDAEDEEDFEAFWDQYEHDYTSHQLPGDYRFNANDEDEEDGKAEPPRSETPVAESAEHKSFVPVEELGSHAPLHANQGRQEDAEREGHLCPGMGCGCGCMICRVE